MSKDVNALFDFIDGAKEAKKSGNKSDPLSDYIAYEKALDFEKELRDVIISTRGFKGWAQFESMRKQSKEAAIQSKYAQIARRNKILNILSIICGMAITLGGGAALIWAAIEFAP